MKLHLQCSLIQTIFIEFISSLDYENHMYNSVQNIWLHICVDILFLQERCWQLHGQDTSRCKYTFIQVSIFDDVPSIKSYTEKL